MSDLAQRLDCIGTGFLWAVHVIGPDDVIPVTSYADSVTLSEQRNKDLIAKMESAEVCMIAVPAIWIRGADRHAAGLAEREGRA